MMTMINYPPRDDCLWISRQVICFVCQKAADLTNILAKGGVHDEFLCREESL